MSPFNLFLFFVTFNVAIADIQYDYVEYPGKISYRLHTDPLIWAEARKQCELEGAKLAMPMCEDEAKILKNILNDYNPIHGPKPKKLLLGYHDMFIEGEHLLDNGDTIQYAYHKWAPNQPDNRHNEDCGSLTTEGELNDFPCSVPEIYACEKRTIKDIRETDLLCPTKDPEYKYSSKLGSCYKIHLVPRMWPSARAICHAEGAHLAIIDSKAEEDYILKLINLPQNIVDQVPHKCCALIGFHDMFKEGQFVTVTGENLVDMPYVNWNHGNPSNSWGKENCGSLHKDGGLNDIYCDTPAPYVCEMKTYNLDVRTGNA